MAPAAALICNDYGYRIVIIARMVIVVLNRNNSNNDGSNSVCETPVSMDATVGEARSKSGVTELGADAKCTI